MFVLQVINSVMSYTDHCFVCFLTAGLRSMTIASATGCALFGLYTIGRYAMGYSDRLIIFNT